MLKVPRPPTRLTPPGVKSVAPSLKSTVPVGVPLPGAPGPTVAVNETDCPNTDALGKDASVRLAASLETAIAAVPLPLAKLPSLFV